MYERQYGAKYDENLSTKEIAQKFRQDVKEAVAAGAIPKAKLSVVTRRFAGGSAIDVFIKDVSFQVITEESVEHDHDHPHSNECVERYTDEAKHLKSQLEGMLQAYNHDGSDITTDYFDVKFYGGVTWDWQFILRQTEEINESLRDRSRFE